MTKAEAFEYLKGKKVKCYNLGEHYGEELLKKLAECGCTSNIFLPKEISYVWAIFISDVCDLSILDTAYADQYGNYNFCEISAYDILSIEIVEDKKEEADNISNDLEKWIEIIRNKYCRNGWSFVISESNYGFIKGDLIDGKKHKE